MFRDRSKIKFRFNNSYDLNKFFYKQIGKKHYWKDRLYWSNKDWEKHVENKNLHTWVMLINDEFSGFYEMFFHVNTKEVEILQLGLLEKYFGKKLGGYLLTHALRKAWDLNPARVRVHTCSLDHPNALKNYLSRGMKEYKQEVVRQETI